MPRRSVSITQVHRGLTVVAGVLVLSTMYGNWAPFASAHALGGAVVALEFVATVGVIATALVSRRRRTLVGADLALLALAVVNELVSLRTMFDGQRRSVIDESILAQRATEVLAHGGNPYTGHWFDSVAARPTLLMNGHIASTWGYPPFSLVLNAAARRLLPSVDSANLVCFLAMVAVAVFGYVVLPAHLHGLVIITVFTVSPLVYMVANGFPIAVAVALMTVVAWRWPTTGAGGRLGRIGVIQAVALGLAAATQQLVWFVAVFLLVALWRLRRGELERRPALLVVGRYAGIAALAFAVVNLPFAVASPLSWARGVLSPLVQHAFFNGAGIWLFSLRVIGGSGALDFYSYGAGALLLTLLVATALYPRRLAPLALVIPTVVFVVSLRSQVLYLQTFLPAVLIAFASTNLRMFDTAAPLRLPARTAPRLRPVLPALGGVVALACVVTALVTPAPLRVRLAQLVRAHGGDRRITAVQVRLTNRSDSTISPHFTSLPPNGASTFWLQIGGRRALAPGQSSTYLLLPSTNTAVLTGAQATRLLVVSDDPQTLSSVAIPAAS